MAETPQPNPLGRVALFRGVALAGLQQLAQRSVRRTFPPGAVIMRQGDIGDTMHVILRGVVRVERTSPDLPQALELAKLGPGEVVGEMGVLDSLPRTATVTAIDPVETLEINASDLARVMLDHPSAAIALLRTVSRRLRQADELAAYYAERSRAAPPPAEGPPTR